MLGQTVVGSLHPVDRSSAWTMKSVSIMYRRREDRSSGTKSREVKIVETLDEERFTYEQPPLPLCTDPTEHRASVADQQ